MMLANESIEGQRALRSRLQSAKREMADPHVVGGVLVVDLRAVALGLQEYRDTMPLMAEVGDTLSEVATLIEGLCAQVTLLKDEKSALLSTGE